MSSQLNLSICMPTYNFGKYIGETLASILPQMPSGVELIIVDGASTDNTEAVVRAYKDRYPDQITYHRLAARGGIDKDIAFSVSLAKGEYVWLFSSDDVMREGAIQKVLQAIQSHLDVYLCQYTLCGLDIKQRISDSRSLTAFSERVFDLSKEPERKEYFCKAWNTEPFFSFMSSIVINRQKWSQGSVDPIYYGSCFAHVFRIFSCIPLGLTVKAVPDLLLYKRSENDSFMDKGIVHRIGIGIYGYTQIGRQIFGAHSDELKSIERVLRNEFNLRLFLVTKGTLLKNSKDWEQLNQMFASIYKDMSVSSLAKKAVYHLMDPFRARLLRKSYLAVKGFFVRLSSL
jgi:abequosyltransferase